ncbi:glycosyltransferase [Ornithinimicrobium cerasi]|uniref:Glycosyltransferase involved in cell wall bisynthesis n=1 Tax=Ornithinimicrobium cerasi TaxID=2248773 RepID=A0A285VS07_9MICO|nr:glycosyltransferase [Ornithinimicrobium cerasi]SOC56860.1 Glycosyltransferase involved in cell wall bisynthesis [Ornithinimicrobium cerasi]
MLPSETRPVRAGAHPTHTQALPRRTRVGYVVKVYPRFSETFVVTEILAREAAGEDLAIYALRPTTDARFHPQLAQVQAPVTHLPRPQKLSGEWETFTRAHEELPGFGTRLGALMPLLVRLGASDVAQGVELALRVRRDGITHLHVHFATLASWCAVIASALTDVPFTVTTHAKDLFHEDVDRVLLREVLSRAASVIAISDHNARFLAEQVGVPADRVRLVRNGLDLPRFPYRDPGDPHAPLRVLAVGRLVEKKGFTHLVEAVALLRDEVPVELRLVGDGELEQPLRDLVRERGLGDRVHLLGARSQAELVDELAWADLLAAPCVVGADGNADGLPTVLLEAMASGVPCVATAVTGIPEAVQPGGADGPGTGILLDAEVTGLPGRLAGALRAVADPFWPRQEVARAARALVERDYDTRRQTRYLSALERPAPHPVRAAPVPVPSQEAS